MIGTSRGAVVGIPAAQGLLQHQHDTIIDLVIHKAAMDAFNILQPLFSGNIFEKLLNVIKYYHNPSKNPGTGKPRLKDEASTKDKQKQKEGNNEKKKETENVNPSSDQKTTTLCTICGNKHPGECKFKGHTSANHEPNTPFLESTKGKEYQKETGHDALKSKQLGTTDKVLMDKQTKSNKPNRINNTLCQSCTSCQSCLNLTSIPIDMNTNCHLLSSYIKVDKKNEPMLIKAPLDSGTLGQDDNYINQSVFNRLRLSNNIVVVNKKSQSCNAILNACNIKYRNQNPLAVL